MGVDKAKSFGPARTDEARKPGKLRRWFGRTACTDDDPTPGEEPSVDAWAAGDQDEICVVTPAPRTYVPVPPPFAATPEPLGTDPAPTVRVWREVPPPPPGPLPTMVAFAQDTAPAPAEAPAPIPAPAVSPATASRVTELEQQVELLEHQIQQQRAHMQEMQQLLEEIRATQEPEQPTASPLSLDEPEPLQHTGSSGTILVESTPAAPEPDASVSPPTIVGEPAEMELQGPQLATVAPPEQTTAAGLELYTWQNAALDAWRRQEQRGVVQAVTGTGKTRVGTAARIGDT